MLNAILVLTWAPQCFFFIFDLVAHGNDQRRIDAFALPHFGFVVPAPEKLYFRESRFPAGVTVGWVARLVEELGVQLDPQQGAAHAELRRWLGVVTETRARSAKDESTVPYADRVHEVEFHGGGMGGGAC